MAKPSKGEANSKKAGKQTLQSYAKKQAPGNKDKIKASGVKENKNREKLTAVNENTPGQRSVSQLPFAQCTT